MAEFLPTALVHYNPGIRVCLKTHLPAAIPLTFPHGLFNVTSYCSGFPLVLRQSVLASKNDDLNCKIS